MSKHMQVLSIAFAALAALFVSACGTKSAAPQECHDYRDVRAILASLGEIPAEEKMLEMMRRCPDALAAKSKYFEHLFVTGRVDEAFQFFDSEIATVSDDPHFFADAGFLAAESGHSDRAREYYRKAIRGTSDVSIHAEYMEIVCAEGRGGECRRAASRVLEILGGAEENEGYLRREPRRRALEILEYSVEQ